MADSPKFDIQQAHTYFSAKCFKKTWEYIDKVEEHSIEESMEMLHTAIVSLWHWSQREDVKPENLSVGYWQISRIYCLLMQPHNARTYGFLALKHAKDLSPLYKAYAYETLARAEMITKNRVIMANHLEKAQAMLEQVENEAAKQLLAKDLESIH